MNEQFISCTKYPTTQKGKGKKSNPKMMAVVIVKAITLKTTPTPYVGSLRAGESDMAALTLLPHIYANKLAILVARTLPRRVFYFSPLNYPGNWFSFSLI